MLFYDRLIVVKGVNRMTHELMQMLILGFIGMILLFYIGSMISGKKQKKLRIEKVATLQKELKEYQARMVLLDEAKITLSERYRDNPFPHLRELHEELVANMNESSEVINKMVTLYKEHEYMDELKEYDVHIRGYVETFKKQDAYFNELLTKLHQYIQEKQKQGAH